MFDECPRNPMPSAGNQKPPTQACRDLYSYELAARGEGGVHFELLRYEDGVTIPIAPAAKIPPLNGGEAGVTASTFRAEVPWLLYNLPAHTDSQHFG